jgi:hypothetical protein
MKLMKNGIKVVHNTQGRCGGSPFDALIDLSYRSEIFRAIGDGGRFEIRHS